MAGKGLICRSGARSGERCKLVVCEALGDLYGLTEGGNDRVVDDEVVGEGGRRAGEQEGKWMDDGVDGVKDGVRWAIEVKVVAVDLSSEAGMTDGAAG